MEVEYDVEVVWERRKGDVSVDIEENLEDGGVSEFNVWDGGILGWA